MTTAWKPETTPNTVVGRTGFRYDDCSTVEAVEAHLVVVSRRIKGCTVQTLIDGLRADQNALLSRRAYLLHPEAA